MREKRYCFVAIAAAALVVAFPSCNSSNRSDERQVAAAENEVYEAVVRDMLKPNKVPARLVFDDTVLTELVLGPDTQPCEDTARKNLRLHNKPLYEYDSFADKLYRFVNQGYLDDPLRADTIQDFVRKSCMTAGRLSQDFHTDLPKTFIEARSVHFSDLIVNDGSESFEQLFPGATGISAFSQVGFDSTLHEAIVSTSFVCGQLCGIGHRYVLRKVHGHWQVVNKWMVWVS